MSTTTAPHPSPAPNGGSRPSPVAGVTGVLRSEWTKLRSVRSTVWSLLALAVITIGMAALICAATNHRWSHLGIRERLVFDPTNRSLRGLFLAELAIGVLGILVITNEYGTGMVRATLAAVPNRPLVLAAKAAVFGAVALVVSEVVTFVAFFVGQSFFRSPVPHATLGQPGVLRAVIGSGLYLAVLGLIALGLGSIIRHTAGAISTFVALLLILPLLLNAFPTSVQDAVGKYLPLTIAGAMTSVHTTAKAFTPWGGLALLAGYAVAILVVAGVLFVRRDA